jgi:hypothetical protein
MAASAAYRSRLTDRQAVYRTAASEFNRGAGRTRPTPLPDPLSRRVACPGSRLFTPGLA